jgi:hypothetical protein
MLSLLACIVVGGPGVSDDSLLARLSAMDQRFAELSTQNAEMQAQNAEMQARILQLEHTAATLRTMVADLREGGGFRPHNGPDTGTVQWELNGAVKAEGRRLQQSRNISNAHHMWLGGILHQFEDATACMGGAEVTWAQLKRRPSGQVELTSRTDQLMATFWPPLTMHHPGSCNSPPTLWMQSPLVAQGGMEVNGSILHNGNDLGQLFAAMNDSIAAAAASAASAATAASASCPGRTDADWTDAFIGSSSVACTSPGECIDNNVRYKVVCDVVYLRGCACKDPAGGAYYSQGYEVVHGLPSTGGKPITFTVGVEKYGPSGTGLAFSVHLAGGRVYFGVGTTGAGYNLIQAIGFGGISYHMAAA